MNNFGFDSEDRAEQVNWLRQEATDIARANWGVSAVEAVDYWMDEDNLPSWFDDHDRILMIGIVLDAWEGE